MTSTVLEQVHAQLSSLTSANGPAHRNSARATQQPNRPLDISEERLRFQRTLLDELLSTGEELIEREGFAAVVVTAGPPGAGK